MYYCNNCGTVVFVNRPENKKKVDAPSFKVQCLVCHTESTYRKLVPEDFRAPNVHEFDQKIKKLKLEIKAVQKLVEPQEEDDFDIIEQE